MPVLPIDVKLPGIRLMNQIGEGGMSTVWKAMDEKSGRTVAVKILNRNFSRSQADLVQFEQEAKAMAEISHAGIVKSYEFGNLGDVWYYVMEYVDGYNFGDLLRRKQHLIEVDCLLICQSVAMALDYAWNDHGIVHCDIKPENIMINTDGIVKLTDLGLCYTYRFLQDERTAAPDHVMGTPGYISPEQVYGDVELDCRSDIYSLAATLYHLATGRVMFPGLDPDSTMRSHCYQMTQAKDPRVYRPELSEGFCQMLEAMLVKDRNGRVQDWREVYAMCLDVEKGVCFKKRAGDMPSSLKLLP